MRFGPKTVKRAKRQAAFFDRIADQARIRDPILARQAEEMARRARRVAQKRR
jgi:hypothetical protein